jgi:hypothetical protein
MDDIHYGGQCGSVLSPASRRVREAIYLNLLYFCARWADRGFGVMSTATSGHKNLDIPETV